MCPQSMQKHKRLKHPEGIASSDAVGIPTSENQQLQNAQVKVKIKHLINYSEG